MLALRSLLPVSLLLLLGCGSSGSPPPAEPPAASGAVSPPDATSASARAPYRLRDATAPVLRYLDVSSGLDADARVAKFRELVVDADPDLYQEAVLGRGKGTWKGLDARLREALPGLDAHADGIRRISGQLATDLEKHDRTFRAAFPDMAWSGTVAFTASLDAFDGALRPVGGELMLLFGVDKIASLHGADARIGPLFHHELFHCYHHDVNPTLESTPESHGVLEPLWAEGLAVYVAATLTPDATPAELAVRDPMTAEVDARQGALARELRAHLDDIDEEKYRDFFLGSGQRADVPKRAAYLIGFRVAKHVATATGASLPELARLRRPELRDRVDAALAALEEPGAATSSSAPSTSAPR